MKAKRLCAGEYEYTVCNHTVIVSQIEPNPAYGDTKPMWIAAAKWSNDIYTDPLETKREAVNAARQMLNAAAAR